MIFHMYPVLASQRIHAFTPKQVLFFGIYYFQLSRFSFKNKDSSIDIFSRFISSLKRSISNAKIGCILAVFVVIDSSWLLKKYWKFSSKTKLLSEIILQNPGVSNSLYWCNTKVLLVSIPNHGKSTLQETRLFRRLLQVLISIATRF